MKAIFRAAVGMAVGVGLITAAGCAASEKTDVTEPAGSSRSPEREQGTSPEGDIQNGEFWESSSEEAQAVAANYQCGQIAILGTFELRLHQGLSNSGAGEAGQQAQQEMLDDLWASTLTTQSPIKKHILAIQKATTDGDQEKYDSAYADASEACRVNGTGIVMQFLPGEGG